MTIARKHWLAGLGMALGLPGLVSAEHLVWRPAANTPPVPAVTSVGPIATLGRPVPGVAPEVPTPPAAAYASAPRQPSVQRTAFIRAQSAEADPYGPLPPPPSSDPLLGGPPAPPARSSDDPLLGGPLPVSPAGLAALRADSPTDIIPPPPSPPPGSDGAGGTIPVSGEAPPSAGGTPLGLAPPQPAIPPLTPHLVSGPPDSVPPPTSAPFSAPDVTPGVYTDTPVAPGMWEKMRGWFSFGDVGSANGRCCFQSDRCFPGLISPVTMPFYFEDPRSLTEARPLFMYQKLSDNTPYVKGGNAYFFGSQFRLALTEQFSFVLSELGMFSLHPDTPAPLLFPDETGFAEVKMGPKYTFYRNANSGTIAAAGVNFELPVGSDKVFQNNGSLSIDPYVSFGQTFGQVPGGYGSFNFLANLGYSFSIDDKRSEFLYTNMHVDFNLANANTLYPLLELNWIRYTSAGSNFPLGTEGADLINFGSPTRRGKDYISLATGLRYRFTEHLMLGAAVQFPVSRENGLSDYRLTFDFIFRY